MERDLAVLPLYFAKPTDYILVEDKPDDAFYQRLGLLGIQLPVFISKQEISLPSPVIKPLNRLLPWGWSPAEHKLLAPLKPFCSDKFQQSPVFQWKAEHKALASRRFALRMLKEIIRTADEKIFIAPTLTGEICSSKQEIEKLLARWEKIMVKIPWSSSGRGLQTITKTPVHPKVWEKILGSISSQGFVIVEPLLNKVLDFAFQFEIKNGIVNYLGESRFTTDKKGQYTGNQLNGFSTVVSGEIIDFIMSAKKILVPLLVKTLKTSEIATSYEGKFGIDTLVFLDEYNMLKINPCLEINMRHNMGLLSLFLERLLLPGTKGVFRTWYDTQKRFTDFTNEMEKRYPLMIKGQKIKKGYFPLTHFSHNSRFGAYLLVE